MLQENRAIIAGRVIDTPAYAFSLGSRNFYRFYMATMRTSGRYDVVPCVATEDKTNYIGKDDYIEVVGAVRAKSRYDEHDNSHIDVYVAVDSINPYIRERNEITLIANTYKPLFIRETPSGRTIGNTMVINNMSAICSNLIPVLVWNKGTRVWNELGLNTEMHIIGRFQSRKFFKKIDGIPVEKTAYEISVMRFTGKENKNNGSWSGEDLK